MLTAMGTYAPQNLNLCMKIDIESDVGSENDKILHLDLKSKKRTYESLYILVRLYMFLFCFNLGGILVVTYGCLTRASLVITQMNLIVT